MLTLLLYCIQLYVIGKRKSSKAGIKSCSRLAKVLFLLVYCFSNKSQNKGCVAFVNSYPKLFEINPCHKKQDNTFRTQYVISLYHLLVMIFKMQVSAGKSCKASQFSFVYTCRSLCFSAGYNFLLQNGQIH